MKSYAGAAPSTSVSRAASKSRKGGGERGGGSAVGRRELDFGERDGGPVGGGCAGEVEGGRRGRILCRGR